jgi:hypothetical protein
MGTEGADEGTGRILDERAIAERLNRWAKRVGVVPGSGRVNAEEISRRLLERGVQEWVADGFAGSVVEVGRLRMFWQDQACSAHDLDPIFALGDSWGILVALEELIERCIDEVPGDAGISSTLRPRVATLVTSVGMLHGALMTLATLRRQPLPRPLPFSPDTIRAGFAELVSG